MYRQSQRTGYRNWKLTDRVERCGNGCYRRQIVAVDSFGIPHTNQYVREGELGGWLECDAEGNVYPIVSADSWVDSDSNVEAGALIDKSYLLNSSAGAYQGGGEFIYSTTWHRKSYIIDSVVRDSQLFGETLVSEIWQDNQSRETLADDVEEVRRTDNLEKAGWTNHKVWELRDALVERGFTTDEVLKSTKILEALHDYLQNN